MDVLLEVYKKKSVHISAVYVFQFDRMRHSEWMAIKLASKCRQNVVKMSSKCRQNDVKMSSKCHSLPKSDQLRVLTGVEFGSLI